MAWPHGRAGRRRDENFMLSCTCSGSLCRCMSSVYLLLDYTVYNAYMVYGIPFNAPSTPGIGPGQLYSTFLPRCMYATRSFRSQKCLSVRPSVRHGVNCDETKAPSEKSSIMTNRKSPTTLPMSLR